MRKLWDQAISRLHRLWLDYCELAAVLLIFVVIPWAWLLWRWLR